MAVDAGIEFGNKNEKIEEEKQKIYKNFIDYCHNNNLNMVKEMRKEVKKIINLNIDTEHKVYMIMELIFETSYEW